MSITQVFASFHRMKLQPPPEDPTHGSGIAQLLEEILEHIFGFVTFADVKSARLVNKHWRQVATTLLRRSSKQIELNRSVAKCIIKMGDGQFPVNRFLIHFKDLKRTKIRSAYFRGICAWVKELTLSVHINNRSPVQVLDHLATFPTDCVYKDLTHFNLLLNQWTDLCQESWNRFTNFIRSILEQSPNLQEWFVNVELEHMLPAAETAQLNRTICPIIEILFPMSNSVGTSKHSSINFEKVPLEMIDLAKWSTLNLKLRRLGLNLSRFSETNELLEKFLQTQTGTLKEFTLNLSRRDSKAPTATYTFPRLENLEQLRVTCEYFYEVVSFAGIDYARLFPSLKTLDLKDDPRTWRDFLGNDLLESTNTVEELIFPRLLRNDVNPTPNPAVTAAKLFPCLKKLEIHADPFLIKAVYENMPNLEVLTLSYWSYESYEDIITGLELEVCRSFTGVMTETWIKELQEAEGRSMARLQNLKTLKLPRGGFYPLSISRLSLHVFKKMSSLKCLDLFDGCAAAAQRRSVHEDQKQFLDELRANFVVL